MLKARDKRAGCPRAAALVPQEYHAEEAAEENNPRRQQRFAATFPMPVWKVLCVFRCGDLPMDSEPEAAEAYQ